MKSTHIDKFAVIIIAASFLKLLERELINIFVKSRKADYYYNNILKICMIVASIIYPLFPCLGYINREKLFKIFKKSIPLTL